MSEFSMARIPLDASNPGQFLACCGLLELAHRRWKGAEGWFEGTSAFLISACGSNAVANALELVTSLGNSSLGNTMSRQQLEQLAHFGGIRARDLSAESKLEKGRLESIRREAPLLIGEPFNLRLDWWLDDRAGGSRFKTWAGQQSVIDIATSMKDAIRSTDWSNIGIEEWMQFGVRDVGLPFNFDSDLGPQAASLDVGFSLDPLGIGTPVRPLIEFAAFVGLQRFRPFEVPKQNRYRYALWQTPLLPAAAAVASTAILADSRTPTFEFPLLYRTKYLKSFLPAQPWSIDA